MQSQACLSIEELALYIGGGVSVAGKLAEMDLHVDTCESCRVQVAAVVRAARRSDDASTQNAIDDGPTIGSLIGRYRVQAIRGSGGMGHVYEAADPDLDRVVAIKTVRNRDATTIPACYVKAERWPGSLTPTSWRYDVGVWTGGVFLAMELVPGVTLREWAKTPGSWREIVRVFVAVARGLDAAHRVGLVHRDIKPDNLIVGHDGRARLIDFGLAIDSTLDPDTLAGTPAYMSPEQRKAGMVDARSDQYGFMVALFETIEGRRPNEPVAFSTAFQRACAA